MTRPALPAGLYAIADAGFGDPAVLGISLAQAGCTVVQLRAKGWSSTQVSRAANQLMPALRELGCLLIINDHVEIAAATGADGIHLGQTDLSPELARQRLGPRPLIGLSTHTLAQVESANLDPAVDYIGFGPLFGTRTKETGWSPRGLSALETVVQQSRHPVVAIGGIRAETLTGVRATRTHGWAVISSLLDAPDLEGAVRTLGCIPS